MCVRASTAGNYASEWRTFESYCSSAHRPTVSPLLLGASWIQFVGPIKAGQIAENVLIGFIGWLAAMRCKDGSDRYHYKASSICKYTRDVRVRKAMERKCGTKFGVAA
jgi:hypothetical protein